MTVKANYTIKDIAREAKVSTATVSRFINKSGHIDDDTAKKVEFIINKFGFTPSRNAQSLKTKKSWQIMFVVPDISNPFYSNMAKTVQSITKDRGYTLTLYDTNEDVSEEFTAIKTATKINADGIILCSLYAKDGVIEELIKSGLKTTVGIAYERCPFDSVHGIMGEGTYLSTRHLIELGHRRIAFAGGPKDSIISSSRRDGNSKALKEAGMEFDEMYSFEMGFSEESGYKAGKYFSSLDPRPTAICCANDLIALGVLSALNENGIRVPDDISITGMDNIPYANLTRPRLTTVINNSEAFGKSAIELLLERIDGTYEGPPREMVFPGKLVIRESTGKIK